jgi:peptide chain release factor 1
MFHLRHFERLGRLARRHSPLSPTLAPCHRPLQHRTILNATMESQVSQACDEHARYGKLLEDGVNEEGRPLDHADYARISKLVSAKTPLVEAFVDYTAFKTEVNDLQELLLDEEMKELAEDDMEQAVTNLEASEGLVLTLLAPKDEADERDALIEIRAGAGGDESSLFATEIIRMYQRYAEGLGWKVELLQRMDNGSVVGGTSNASIAITAPPHSSNSGVFGRLKHESGVHRVQRVPKTESQGRLHTSAVAVVVLPQAEEKDVTLLESDLKIETFRSSGAGGQSVNTTDSAVRVTHVPTGLTVSMQDERSQHRNRAKALSVLLSRLYDHERSIVNAERDSKRNQAVTSADRSQRIRTYNFPQSRITDHRINLTLNGSIDNFMNGETVVIDQMLDALIQQEKAEALASLFE